MGYLLKICKASYNEAMPFNLCRITNDVREEILTALDFYIRFNPGVSHALIARAKADLQNPYSKIENDGTQTIIERKGDASLGNALTAFEDYLKKLEEGDGTKAEKVILSKIKRLFQNSLVPYTKKEN